ncbi:MAG TPA: hypothetical protein VD997_16470 [Phycisphaerales bacterium]|nr:hypothetical protein [Phycisphaerales bacterium]
MDRHCSNNSRTDSRRGAPGRHDEPRSRPSTARPTHPPPNNQPTPVLRTPIADALRELLGPMRWLGAPKGSDLSEALGGMPGDAGWLLQLPHDGGLLCITISRRLGPASEETRVVLFQELKGHGGFTWCLAADDPSTLERVKAEIRSLLDDGARVMHTLH